MGRWDSVSPVGVGVGVNVGGGIVRVWVGAAVGDVEGTGAGASVGMGVGDQVGVGCGVSVAVGRKVGVLVGGGVGVAEGDGRVLSGIGASVLEGVVGEAVAAAPAATRVGVTKEGPAGADVDGRGVLVGVGVNLLKFGPHSPCKRMLSPPTTIRVTMTMTNVFLFVGLMPSPPKKVLSKSRGEIILRLGKNCHVLLNPHGALHLGVS